MKYNFPFCNFCHVLIMAAVLHASIQAGQVFAADEIFRKGLDGGLVIVVLRSPVPDAGRLSPILGGAFGSRIDAAYLVSVELHQGDSPAITLASKLHLEHGTMTRGFDVLDVMVRPNAIVLAVTVGTQLGVWRISVGALTMDAWAWLKGWEVQALGSRLDRNYVRARLGSLPDGRLSISVDDLRIAGSPPPSTLFEQDPDNWSFKTVRQARDFLGK